VKLVVEEPESSALLAAIEGRAPYVTSVVGEIETVRVCERANIPAAQVEELRRGLVLIALDDEVRALAGVVGPPMLRTLDAIHLATALTLRQDVEAVIAYDERLTKAVRAVGMPLLSPS
jgi:predicted nucleic acid-binding protein